MYKSGESHKGLCIRHTFVKREYPNQGNQLYVDTCFQSQGIGQKLIEFAIKEFGANQLWALEKNTRAISFYNRQGFRLTGEKQFEEGTTEYLVELKR